MREAVCRALAADRYDVLGCTRSAIIHHGGDGAVSSSIWCDIVGPTADVSISSYYLYTEVNGRIAAAVSASLTDLGDASKTSILWDVRLSWLESAYSWPLFSAGNFDCKITSVCLQRLQLVRCAPIYLSPNLIFKFWPLDLGKSVKPKVNLPVSAPIWDAPAMQIWSVTCGE